MSAVTLLAPRTDVALSLLAKVKPGHNLQAPIAHFTPSSTYSFFNLFFFLHPSDLTG